MNYPFNFPLSEYNDSKELIQKNGHLVWQVGAICIVLCFLLIVALKRTGSYKTKYERKTNQMLHSENIIQLLVLMLKTDVDK